MDRNRPVIGVSAYDLPVSFGQWSDVRSVLEIGDKLLFGVNRGVVRAFKIGPS